MCRTFTFTNEPQDRKHSNTQLLSRSSMSISGKNLELVIKHIDFKGNQRDNKFKLIKKNQATLTIAETNIQLENGSLVCELRAYCVQENCM